MTRLRKNLKKQDEKDQNPYKNKPPTPPPRITKQADGVSAVLCDNWKQQSMVKKNVDYTALTSIMHLIQVISTVGIGAFAASEGGSYIPSAICAAGYTVATISNSFDRDLHGIVGFLDSPFTITALVVLMTTSIFSGGPATVLSGIIYGLCCLPFFVDMLISLQYGFKSLTGQPQSGGATIEELDQTSEHFINMNDQKERLRVEAEDMYDPQDRLLPNFAADGGVLNNLLANNWKENGYRTSNSVLKSVVSFSLILACIFLGGMAVESGDNVALGAMSLGYAGSSLLGYFGLGNVPAIKAMRLNIVPALGAGAGIVSVATGGPNIALIALIGMFMFDTLQGAQQEPEQIIDDQLFERVNTEDSYQANGPVMSFFLESWKVNSFSKKNYATCQATQLILWSCQLFFALICMVDGGSVPILTMILAMIVASSYSFFSPMRLTAIDALQSNGTQLAVLGTATHHMVTAAPDTSFYVLFGLLAIDMIMSCSSFFEQHQRSVGQHAARHMGLLEKNSNGGSGF